MTLSGAILGAGLGWLGAPLLGPRMQGCLAEEGQVSLLFLHRSDHAAGTDCSTSRRWGWDAAQRHPHAGIEPQDLLYQVSALSLKVGVQAGWDGWSGENPWVREVVNIPNSSSERQIYSRPPMGTDLELDLWS